VSVSALVSVSVLVSTLFLSVSKRQSDVSEKFDPENTGKAIFRLVLRTTSWAGIGYRLLAHVCFHMTHMTHSFIPQAELFD
jgi:hypothetical protein